MSNPAHLDALLQGPIAWNAYRESLKALDLSGAILLLENPTWIDLCKADLSGANLSRVNLSGANLSKVHICNGNLSGANLSGANLSDVLVQNVDLSRANLSGAKLSGFLGSVNFSHANLDGADLSGAMLVEAQFSNCDLSKANLESIIHDGPSTIGIDTLYRSGGKISDAFFRGCGVPEDLITYLPSLLGQTIQFYSCFISHSTKDVRFCERLHADLQAKKVRTWYFPDDARWGQPVWGEIDHSIKVYDKLVVALSKHSLTSGPVLREIERALQREDDELRAGHPKHVLFPITLDRFVFDEWQHPRKADVLSKVVGIFQGWNRSDDKYKKAFDQLLRSLQQPDKSASTGS